MSRFKHWAEREYGITTRIAATGLAGIFFVIILPLLIITISLSIDIYLNLPTFFYGFPNLITGGPLILAGATFAMWSIYAQITAGRGTPLPVMATQKLLIAPPFSYCRNPMSLGTIILYSGIAILVGSPSAVIIVFILSILLILYIKKVEEVEMEERFGKEYQAYRESVPFIIPRFSQED